MKNLEKVIVSILWAWQPSRDQRQLSSLHMSASSLSLIFSVFPFLSVFYPCVLWPSSLLNFYFSSKANASFTYTTLEAE